MKFTGRFYNNEGKEVSWWFKAPSEEVLKTHLDSIGWKILSLNSQRPIGVSIFAWLIILGSVLDLLSLLSPTARETNPPFSSILYFIVSPIAIVAAVHLLKMKQWARLVILAVAAVVLAESVVTSPYVLKKWMRRKPTVESLKAKADIVFQRAVEARTKKEGRKLTEIEIKEMEESKQKLLQIFSKINNPVEISIFLFLGSTSLAFNGAVLYYFTRPKVKERFK